MREVTLSAVSKDIYVSNSVTVAHLLIETAHILGNREHGGVSSAS